MRIARPPDQIWGKYNNYRANGLTVSVIVHLALIGLLVSGVFVSHQITQRVTRETVTLIAPSPDTYALPVAKKVISGGGGGGESRSDTCAERSCAKTSSSTNNASSDCRSQWAAKTHG